MQTFFLVRCEHFWRFFIISDVFWALWWQSMHFKKSPFVWPQSHILQLFMYFSCFLFFPPFNRIFYPRFFCLFSVFQFFHHFETRLPSLISFLFFCSYFLECSAEWKTAKVKTSVWKKSFKCCDDCLIFVVIFSPKRRCLRTKKRTSLYVLLATLWLMLFVCLFVFSL